MHKTGIVYTLDPDQEFLKAISHLLHAANFVHKLFENPLALLDELMHCQNTPRPGCILLEIKLPVISGLEVLKRIRQHPISPPVIILTGHADVPSAVHAMKCGAFDFLEKPFTGHALVDLIKHAVDCHSKSLAKHLQHQDLKSRFLTLSKREKQVLELVVSGKPSKHIAEDLGISIHTVDNHRANIMSKMSTDSVADLVRAVVSIQDHD